MADKRIIDFVVLEDAQDEDLLLIASNKTTYAIRVKTIKDAVEGMAQRAEAAALETKDMIENALSVADTAEAKAQLAQEAAGAANTAAEAARAITGTVTTLTEESNAAKDAANAAAQTAREEAQSAQQATTAATTATQEAKAATSETIVATGEANAAQNAANMAAQAAQDKAQLAQSAAAAASTATQEAQAATNAANEATAEANASRDAANTAAQNAQAKAQEAQEATNAANSATTGANNAATAANTAATSAGAAAQNAQTQADYAKGQGDRANELLGKIESTDIGGMAADILDLQNNKASRTELATGLGGKADLVGGKVPAGQLPEMDYDPAGSAAGVQGKLDTHAGDAVKHVTAEERSRWNHYPVPFTIAVSDWIQASPTEKLPYSGTAILEVANLKATDVVNVNFDRDSYAAAEDAGVSGMTYSAEGMFGIFSESIPTENLSGNYIIIKGAPA